MRTTTTTTPAALATVGTLALVARGSDDRSADDALASPATIDTVLAPD